MSGTNYIDQWAAYCAHLGVSFDTFLRGVDEFMSDGNDVVYAPVAA